MNDPNSVNPQKLRAELEYRKQSDAMASTLQSAAEARTKSEANYRVANAFARSAERQAGNPHMQDPVIAQSAEYMARGAEFADEAKQHDKEVDQLAQRLGEHVVQHEAVPEYSPEEPVSVVDLR